MLNLSDRTTILQMRQWGISMRKIAMLLKTSRCAVREVIRAEKPLPKARAWPSLMLKST
jgi:transcriptional regulator